MGPSRVRSELLWHRQADDLRPYGWNLVHCSDEQVELSDVCESDSTVKQSPGDLVLREGEEMWKAAEGPGRELAGLVRSGWKEAKGKGPFFEGDVPGYADLIVVGFLWSTRRHGEEYFERVMEWDEVFRGLWGACQGWMEKVD